MNTKKTLALASVYSLVLLTQPTYAMLTDFSDEENCLSSILIEERFDATQAKKEKNKIKRRKRKLAKLKLQAGAQTPVFSQPASAYTTPELIEETQAKTPTCAEENDHTATIASALAILNRLKPTEAQKQEENDKATYTENIIGSTANTTLTQLQQKTLFASYNQEKRQELASQLRKPEKKSDLLEQLKALKLADLDKQKESQKLLTSMFTSFVQERKTLKTIETLRHCAEQCRELDNASLQEANQLLETTLDEKLEKAARVITDLNTEIKILGAGKYLTHALGVSGIKGRFLDEDSAILKNIQQRQIKASKK